MHLPVVCVYVGLNDCSFPLLKVPVCLFVCLFIICHHDFQFNNSKKKNQFQP